MHLGSVCRWNSQRAYGFILADTDIPGASDREIFVHRSSLPKGVRDIELGQRVEFVTKPSHIAGKQPQAKVVRIIDTEAMAA
jgi:cold shock CspA family protein